MPDRVEGKTAKHARGWIPEPIGNKTMRGFMKAYRENEGQGPNGNTLNNISIIHRIFLNL